MNRSKHQRWLRRFALGFTVAAVAAPSAQAIDPAVVNSPYSPGNTANGDISRPATADVPAAQSSQSPTVAQAYADAWEALQRFRTTPTAAQAYGDAFEAIQRLVPDALPAQVPVSPSFPPLENVKQFSFDGPNPAPSVDAPSTPTQPVSTPGFDWADAGVGIGIGAGLALILGAALAFGRRRGRLANA